MPRDNRRIDARFHGYLRVTDFSRWILAVLSTVIFISRCFVIFFENICIKIHYFRVQPFSIKDTK